MKKFDRVFKQYDHFINLFNLNQEKEIKDLLQLKGHEIVLDIGGGTGRLAASLSKDCQKIYVLDESKGMLSKVPPKDNLVPILGNALAMEFQDKTMDIVVLCDVLHHVKEQAKLMEEINRVLKKDGKLVLLDFEKTNIRIRLLSAFEHILFGKLYFKTSQEVKDLIEKQFTIREFIDKEYYFVIKGEKNA